MRVFMYALIAALISLFVYQMFTYASSTATTCYTVKGIGGIYYSTLEKPQVHNGTVEFTDIGGRPITMVGGAEITPSTCW